LQREFERQDVGIEIDDLRDTIDPALAAVGRQPSDRFRLTIAGIHSLGDGEDVLAAFMGVVRLAYERYKSTTGSPRLTREDVLSMGTDADLAERVRVLLDAEAYVTAGGADQDGTWYRDVSPLVRRLRHADTVSAYLDVMAQATRRARVPVVPQPASEPSDNEINDEELKRRCQDLLGASGDYDRAVREATVVLETRVRSRAGLERTVHGTSLMEVAFSPKNPILVCSTDANEQRGAMELFRGTMAYLRNPASHGLEVMEHAEAAKAVGWIDFLLSRLERAAVSLRAPQATDPI
jgi:uncharacterized protein (TIGR02391 family)